MVFPCRPDLQGKDAVNLDFSPQDVAFRDEVRTFIAENYPDAPKWLAG